MTGAGEPAALRFRVRGMDCVEEVTVLKREVGRVVGGEERLSFNLLEGTMAVASGDAVVAPETILAAVLRTGMRAEVLGNDPRPPAVECRSRSSCVRIS